MLLWIALALGADTPPVAAPAPAPYDLGRAPKLGTVQGSDPLVAGKMDKARIHEVVAADLVGIEACYSSRGPDALEGWVIVRAEVDPSGKTTSSKLRRSHLLDEKVESCVVDRFGRLKFGPTLDGAPAIVVYSFLFLRPR